MKLNFKLRRSKNIKNKSIKTKIILIVSGFIVLCSLLLGTITSYLNYKSANNVLSDTVIKITEQAAENISQKITILKNATIQTGMIKQLSDPNVSVEAKQQIMNEREEMYGLYLGQILDANGIDLFSGNDYSEREYFKISMTGEAYMSSPVISKVTGKTVLVVSAPIWKDGIEGSEVVGVVTFDPDPNFLNSIINDIKISANSYSYLIDKEGTTIADEDPSLVGVENTISESETNSDVLPYAEVDRRLIKGESGVADIYAEGEGWMVGYKPIKDTDGWGIGILSNKNDFLGEMYKSIIIIITLCIILIIGAFIAAKKLANKIGNPLIECSNRLGLLAEGNLDLEDIVIDSEDEIGLVANATTKIVGDFRGIIDSLTYILTEISNGNLDINMDEKRLNSLFVNDFEPILTSVNKIIDNLNDTLKQINVASEQVSVGSNQVAEGAQFLSQGATEQASSIEELSATINEVSNQIKQTAENAIRAKEISIQSSIDTDQGKKQMRAMVVAMEEISSTSNKIENIIKNIDDIAFQTNILALNAAVEAARAGESGKGFAVVADEVRNLAAKSAQSAKDTAELIEKAIVAIENGTRIVSQTAESLEAVVVGTKKSAEVIQEISESSKEQAQHISQVNIGVEQISYVVQQNSATAEESAAASEELSSQAEMLKDFIDKFKLKD